MVLNNLSDIAIKENQFDRLKTYAERSIALAGEMEDEGTLISGQTQPGGLSAEPAGICGGTGTGFSSSCFV